MSEDYARFKSEQQQREYHLMCLETMAKERQQIDLEYLQGVAEINRAYHASMRRLNWSYGLGLAAIWLVFFPLVASSPYWIPKLLRLLGRG